MKASRLMWSATMTVRRAGRTGSKPACFPIWLQGRAFSERLPNNLPRHSFSLIEKSDQGWILKVIQRLLKLINLRGKFFVISAMFQNGGARILPDIAQSLMMNLLSCTPARTTQNSGCLSSYLTKKSSGWWQRVISTGWTGIKLNGRIQS